MSKLPDKTQRYTPGTVGTSFIGMLESDYGEWVKEEVLDSYISKEQHEKEMAQKDKELGLLKIIQRTDKALISGLEEEMSQKDQEYESALQELRVENGKLKLKNKTLKNNYDYRRKRGDALKDKLAQKDQEIQELREFVKWYSGMDNDKIERAYQRFLKERNKKPF